MMRVFVIISPKQRQKELILENSESEQMNLMNGKGKQCKTPKRSENIATAREYEKQTYHKRKASIQNISEN